MSIQVHVQSFFSLLRRACSRILSHEGQVYYICGPDTLPPTLSPEEESELLSRLPEDGAKSALIEHNLRLVVYIARKFENTSVGIEDLISIGTIGLIKAVGTFCPDRGIKLATYASRCIENEILMFIRKSGNRRCELSLDEPLSVDWDGNELLISDILRGDDDSVSRGIEESEERKIVGDAVRSLPERERAIICLRFGMCGRREHTQKEVAELLGISQSYISRLEKRIIDELHVAIAPKL